MDEPDPLVAMCREWLDGAALAEVLNEDCCRLEREVAAGSCGSRELAELERRLDALDHRLDALVDRILIQRPRTAAGIAAKLSLAIRMAGRSERRETSWQLVQRTVEDVAASGA